MLKLFLKQMKGYLWALLLIAYFVGFFWLGHNVIMTNEEILRGWFIVYSSIIPVAGMVEGTSCMIKDIRNRWRRAKKEYYENLLRSIKKLEDKIYV
jgi:hypothetical protein